MTTPLTLLTNDVLLSNDTLTQNQQVLAGYLETMKQASEDASYSFSESSLFLPHDKEMFATVKNVVGEKIQNKTPKYIVVVGIGGSNLGTKAVYDALYGYYDVVDIMRRPVMLFLDTVEALYLEKVIMLLQREVTDQNDMLIFLVSKSGGTPETIANGEILLSALTPTFPDILRRVIAISDESAPLHKEAIAKGIATLTLPTTVGGRYSVLSAVGLAPLFACGVDIDTLVSGACEMEDVCLAASISNNPAIQSALTLYAAMQSGHTVHDTFIFAPALESLGKWYRQLQGESLGKEKDLEGNIVHTGITPTVSIGSTDLHSVGQLYLGGPKNVITSFVSCKEYTRDINMPEERIFPELVPMLTSKRTMVITEAILSGVKESYKKNGIPSMSIILDGISERTLGAFFQFKMMEVMYLGRLLTVNPFDQPSVESYKIETKTILEGESLS